MTFQLYKTELKAPQKNMTSLLPASAGQVLTNPENYRASPDLAAAVNVALRLRQPLLVTGEPGTGKTQLAHSVTWQLGLGQVLEFETQSNSIARDLFYSYDHMSRFHAAQTKTGSDDNLDYLEYQALGKAILLANKNSTVKDFLRPAMDFQHPGEPRLSVVLVDEIDKAPRDFPNDILNQIRRMYFRLGPMNNVKVEADPQWRPILIFTSNSEKHLPDAFLRRCVYYHIPFPEDNELKDIVASRLGKTAEALKAEPVIYDALEFFQKVRNMAPQLQKKPATAELLDWLMLLQDMQQEKGTLSSDDWQISLPCLLKTSTDRESVMKRMPQWLTSE
ncbi:MAG: AAA family ATPase [Calditrichia bacterium]